MHKDTEFDLRKCERSPIGQSRMARDLTQNWEFATTAIAIADRFFKFDFSQVYFSGFVHADDYGQPFTVEIWNRTKLYYSVEFPGQSIEGILHVDLKQDDNPEKALGQDILGAIKKAVNKELNLTPNCPRMASIEVADNGMLSLNILLKP